MRTEATAQSETSHRTESRVDGAKEGFASCISNGFIHLAHETRGERDWYDLHATHST